MILSIQHACDVLIVGSGAAGLSVALSLADHSQVIVLSKSNIKEGSTRYAQGVLQRSLMKKMILSIRMSKIRSSQGLAYVMKMLCALLPQMQRTP